MIRSGDGPGVSARVRDVVTAGPDARLVCRLEDGGVVEVRVAHEEAAKFAPRDKVRLTPKAVRVWA